MELLARLEPRVDPNELLMQGLTERKTIEIKTNGTTRSLILGRGVVTGISDNTIGKSVVQISFDDFCRDEQSVKATLLKDSEKSKVHVNGIPWRRSTTSTCFLSSGDVISLDGLRYEYRLHISECRGEENATISAASSETDAISISSSSPSSSPVAALAPASEKPVAAAPFTPTTKAALAPPSEKPVAAAPSTPITATTTTTDGSVASSVAITTDKASRISDELQCSVCLEIQVYPRTLNPCGHSFCAPCLKQLKNCPQCRETIDSHVPAMQLDSLIAMLVSVPSLLDQDDVKQYHERKKCSKVAPVVYNKAKPKKRRRTERVDQHGQNLQLFPYQMPSNLPQHGIAFGGMASHLATAAMAGGPNVVDLSRASNQFFMPPFAAAPASTASLSASSRPTSHRRSAAADDSSGLSSEIRAAAARAVHALQRSPPQYQTTGTSAAPISID